MSEFLINLDAPNLSGTTFEDLVRRLEGISGAVFLRRLRHAADGDRDAAEWLTVECLRGEYPEAVEAELPTLSKLAYIAKRLLAEPVTAPGEKSPSGLDPIPTLTLT